MLDFNTLAEFSRNNCIGICAFLVPANILTTLLTMILTFLNRPQGQVRISTGLACLFASVMVLHVYTWFMIGVVMTPTYILLSLAVTCLLTNLLLIIWRRNSLQLFSLDKQLPQKSKFQEYQKLDIWLFLLTVRIVTKNINYYSDYF